LSINISSPFVAGEAERPDRGQPLRRVAAKKTELEKWGIISTLSTWARLK
jgi:hypothetical protein